MIGMSFTSFVILLVLGFIAALVLHELLRYRVLSGVDGFIRMWLAGWIGGWLGSPVLGHWSFQIKDVYIIPALGAHLRVRLQRWRPSRLWLRLRLHCTKVPWPHSKMPLDWK